MNHFNFIKSSPLYNASLVILLSVSGLSSCTTLRSSAVADNSATEAVVQNLCWVDDENYYRSLRTVWELLPETYEFSNEHNARIQRHLNILESRQRYFNAIGERAEKYLFYVHEEVTKRGLPGELALLPVIESGFDPFAYSHGRAAGMWQFIPGTARIFNLESNWWYEGRRDVEASTQAALNYLERLYRRFDGDWLLALAAYNAGSGNVMRAINKNKQQGKPYDYWHLELPKETMDYVPKLIALAQVVQNPHDFNVTLKYIPNAPYFAQVDAQGQIDLSQVAQLANASMNDVYLLNPGFNRWATEPGKNRKLLVPYESEYAFEENIQSIDKADRLAWTRYEIKSGDTLSTIASRHHVNIDFLKSINNLRSNTIRVGQTLMIPGPLENNARYQLSQSQRQLALSQQERQGKQRINYQVKPNDSFWSIAKHYNVAVRDLARWNGVAPGDTLRIGQQLNVWVDTEIISQREIVRNVHYTVRQGDSLSRIANRFNVTILDIKNWNQLHENKYIQPGQKLVLRVNVTQ